MSSYQQLTKHPKTKKFELAWWIDNFYAQHHYGVRFPDGSVYDPEKKKLQTKEFMTYEEAYIKCLDIASRRAEKGKKERCKEAWEIYQEQGALMLQLPPEPKKGTNVTKNSKLTKVITK